MSENGLDPSPEKEKPLSDQQERRSAAAGLRSTSYVLLLVGAVFVINAMETGSYRTPWPVAIIVSLAGLALLAYSLVKSAPDQDNG